MSDISVVEGILVLLGLGCAGWLLSKCRRKTIFDELNKHIQEPVTLHMRDGGEVTGMILHAPRNEDDWYLLAVDETNEEGIRVFAKTVRFEDVIAHGVMNPSKIKRGESNE